VRTDDELSLAEKVAKFPQHKRDQIFAGYTQADFAALSSIHDGPGYSRSVPLADVATHCNRPGAWAAIRLALGEHRVAA
jgi:hypothetical protein